MEENLGPKKSFVSNVDGKLFLSDGVHSRILQIHKYKLLLSDGVYSRILQIHKYKLLLNAGVDSRLLPINKQI